jgi:hypothetical protein
MPEFAIPCYNLHVIFPHLLTISLLQVASIVAIDDPAGWNKEYQFEQEEES